MDTCKRIKERREQLSLKLTDIADFLGVSEATAQRYESGNIKNIKIDTIVKMSSILKTSPEYLLGLTEEVSEEKQELPDEFVVIARKMGDMPLEDKYLLYKIFDSNIDTFLEMRKKKGE